MWKKIDSSQYYLSFNIENAYEICVTDFVSIWSVFFCKEEFLSHLKETNNILILANDSDYIKNCNKMLSNPEQLKKYKIDKEDNGNTLFLSMTVLYGYPFTFECRLSKGADKFYFQKITQNLLKTVMDLRTSETELRNLLKQKDKEIYEYKEEGGELVFKHLKTDTFNDEEHMLSHTLYKEYFGDADVAPCLLNKHVELPFKEVVKQEPNSVETTVPAEIIKREPESQVTENATMPHNTLSAPVHCKQEVIKTEPVPILSSPRKRMKKLNY